MVSIPAPTQAALRTLEWGERRENPVVCGPSGTGKTMFLEALGHDAVTAGRKVAWFSLETSGVLVSSAATAPMTPTRAPSLASSAPTSSSSTTSPPRRDTRRRRRPLPPRRRRLREAQHRRQFQHPPQRFDEIMPKTLAGATVDRLLHHAHLCATTGDSIRLAQATTGDSIRLARPPPAKGSRP